jgi:enamine deaminase RidA (YjgF/YER057c/UK114 family)
MVERRLVASGSPFETTIGFSRAVRVGDRVLVSGTRRCLDIIERALNDAGVGLADVVRTRMFLVDQGDAATVGQVHGAVFGAVRPAATMVVVAALLDPRWRVEIEAEAVIARVDQP